MAEFFKNFPLTVTDPVLGEDIEVECWFHFYPERHGENAYVDIVDIRHHGYPFAHEFSPSEWSNIEGSLLEQILSSFN